MRRAWVAGILGSALLAGPLFVQRPARADPLRNRWYVGANVAFHTTEDKVENNADMSFDPRPRSFTDRDITIEDSLAYDVNVGFGMTGRLALQLDVGYFNESFGPLDIYLTDTFPAPSSSANPTQLTTSRSRQLSLPITAGRITEIPVALTGVLRFRTDRVWRPYVTAGAGYLFTEVEIDDDVPDLNERLSKLRIMGFFDEVGRDLTPRSFRQQILPGKIPSLYPVDIEIDDGFETHLSAGLEYVMTDRFAVYAEARYMFTGQTLSMTLAGEDQVSTIHYPEALFRADGSLRMFRESGKDPNPHQIPDDPTSNWVTCPRFTIGDFDNDGHADDLCYPVTTPLRGSMLIQGGDISLGGYSLKLGLRFFF